jgi:nucleotide-binding universal stress UspA family protein
VEAAMTSKGPDNIKHRIVVGADLSETGDHALREAVRLAQHLPDSELHVTYVVATTDGVHDSTELRRMSDELRSKLDELRGHVTTVCAPPAGSAPIAIETVFHVRIGPPATALHQVAIDVDADLIVVGTHQRAGVERLMLGSVAEELVRIARLPVLVAHPKDLRGLRHSDHPEPARPGENLWASGISHRVRIELVPRNSHISGLV